MAPGIHQHPDGDPAFASKDKDKLVKYVHENTGDSHKQIESQIKKKAGHFVWRETEDILPDKKGEKKMKKAIMMPSEIKKAEEEQILDGILVKGRAFGEGTIRTHGGVKVKKVGKRWVPVAAGATRKDLLLRAAEKLGSTEKRAIRGAIDAGWTVPSRAQLKEAYYTTQAKPAGGRENVKPPDSGGLAAQLYLEANDFLKKKKGKGEGKKKSGLEERAELIDNIMSDAMRGKGLGVNVKKLRYDLARKSPAELRKLASKGKKK